MGSCDDVASECALTLNRGNEKRDQFLNDLQVGTTQIYHGGNHNTGIWLNNEQRGASDSTSPVTEVAKVICADLYVPAESVSGRFACIGALFREQ